MNPLVTADELAELVAEGTVRIADVRWYLEQLHRGHEAYHEGHIPGAVHVDLEHHLSAAEGPGRHPLPDRETFAATMGRLGFGSDDLIVAYDDRGGMVAARLWWMLRDIGHERVRVLDGGLQAWLDTGHPVAEAPAAPASRSMSVGRPVTRQLDRISLKKRIGVLTLIDARAGERYRGEHEPVDPVAGHIPSARSVPAQANLADEGGFREASGLLDLYREAGADQGDVAVYCGSGVTACHDILAMRVAGLPEPYLYPGSFSDWSSAGEPVATGD